MVSKEGGVPAPKTPEGPPPEHHPKQPSTPPPNQIGPSVGKGAGLANRLPSPPSHPPTVFAQPRAKSRPPIVGAGLLFPPADRPVQSGLTRVAVERDRYMWGEGPHSQADELWRDPTAIASIQVDDPDQVFSFADQDASIEEEEQTAELGAAEGAPHQLDQEEEEEEEVDDYLNEEQIEAEFLAGVRPPSRPPSKPSSREPSLIRQSFLVTP